MRQQALRLLRCAGSVREALTSQGAGKALAQLGESGSVSNIFCQRFISSRSRSLNLGQSVPHSFAFSSALQKAGITTSVAPQAAGVAVDGDLVGVSGEIDRILSSEIVSAKDVSDAAVALAYLQAKEDRRLWGKVFQQASNIKGSFDAASLTSFLWAATTAGVEHFKTIAELAGPASSLVGTLNPTQISVIVEALGKAGVKDAELFGKISAQITPNIAKFKPSELSRVLWGFAAAHHDDGALVKAISKALTEKASELAPKEAVQAIWALAKTRRTDKATLDVLVKSAKGKLGALESPVDAAALAWSLGFLNYKPDAQTTQAIAAALKAGAAELSASHAVDAAWGLSLIGSTDKDAATALFGAAAAAVQKDPGSVDVYSIGALYNAAVLTPGAKLPEQVQAFALKCYNLGGESLALKRSSAATAFKEDLAQATARAFGARYRPEVSAAVKSYATTTPEGLTVDIAVVHDSIKIAVEPVNASYCSATHPSVLLGPAVARAGLLESAGFKVVSVPHGDWLALKDDASKASYVLNAVKTAVPGAKVDALLKKLSTPFNPYAE